jgi:hypothetical protein
MRRASIFALALCAAACGREKSAPKAAADTSVLLPGTDTSVKPAGEVAPLPQVAAPVPVATAIPTPAPAVSERPKPPIRRPVREAESLVAKTPRGSAGGEGIQAGAPATNTEAPKPPPRIESPPPPRLADGMRTIVVLTTPPGARVRLHGAGPADTVSGQKTSYSVRPGVYSYEVEMPNYVAERSRQRMIDVTSKLVDTISITLVPVDGEGRLDRGDSLFRVGKCPEAITSYQSVPAPSDLGGAAGGRWLETRLKTGQCFRRLREYDKAIQTFEQLLHLEPGQWAAKYTMGLTHCDKTKYPEGIQVLREMQGQFSGLVSVEKKAGVRALAQYGMALCSYQDLTGRSFPDRFPELRERVVGGFEEFVQAADALIAKSRISDGALNDGLRTALEDAKRKLRSLSGS